ncbi:MAG TPA: VanW family protein [Kofleriaceae bacterium]|nr:VanW family protein [Kofleriaceae bacterium]
MPPRRPRTESRHRRGSIYLGLAAGLFAASGALLVGYYATSHTEVPTASAATDSAPKAGASAELSQAVEASLAGTVTVKADGATRELSWSELGVVVDPAEVGYAARKASGAGAVTALASRGSLPVKLDEVKTLAALAHLKATIDRAPQAARLDLEARTISDDVPGFAIDVYASLDRIETAARTGATTIELAGVPLQASTTRAQLGIEDISHVLGTQRTTFPVTDKERNFNLKLAASKLDGHVIGPHEDFSFNGVVGDRTEKEGYKIAHVIQAGEMVDGLAGGTCQISTTLYGAAFFAGLDIVKQTPHSRPSVYVPMGFDATVVYPSTDLELRNPYDFPVVIHYRVARGEALVEILGKERPWDKVVFERHVLDTKPFETEERPDDTLPVGYQAYDQEGFNGYKLTRLRKFIKGGVEVKVEKWNVEYKPVTEYIRKGTNPDTTIKVPDPKPPHGPKPPKSDSLRIEQ